MRTLLILASSIALAYGCGQAITGSGSFQSPNYPSDYDNNADCTWTLTATPGRYVCLTFSAFALESHSSCSYDSLTVAGTSGTEIGKYCGTTNPGAISTGLSSVSVRFTSDSSLSYGGFSASFTSCDESTPPVNPPSGCGGTFNEEEGTFSSPGYPSNYANNLNCVYTFNVGQGPIRISIANMDIESHSTCNYDYLEHQGNKVCGTGGATFVESTGTATLTFVTDSSVPAGGFTGSWKRLTCADYNGECVTTACDGSTRNVPCDNGGVCCVPVAECGKIPKYPNMRIINGSHALAHSWPWQASLQTTSSSFHFCGATLVQEQWLVTAAHCIDGDSPSSIKVVLGEHHIDEAGVESSHAIEQIIPHENYNTGAGAFPNDIALIKLIEPVTMSDYIQPACLAEEEDTFLGNDNCWITGWGNTDDVPQSPDYLQELNIKVMDQAQCAIQWGDNINSGHICLGNGTSGACNGDSGGPLVCRNRVDGEDYWKLAGATSWGYRGCMTAGFPSVYSRISYFRDWIDLKMSTIL